MGRTPFAPAAGLISTIRTSCSCALIVMLGLAPATTVFAQNTAEDAPSWT